MSLLFTFYMDCGGRVLSRKKWGDGVLPGLNPAYSLHVPATGATTDTPVVIYELIKQCTTDQSLFSKPV